MFKKVTYFHIIFSFFYCCKTPQMEKVKEQQQSINDNNIYNQWVKEIKYINEPSELFSFDISFTKGDSSILYIVESTTKDHCEPIYLKHLIVHKNQVEYFNIRFRHHYRINKVTEKYKDLDISKVEEIFLFSNKNKKKSIEHSGIRLSKKREIYDFLYNECEWK